MTSKNNTNKQRIPLIVIAMIAITGTAIASTADVFATVSPTTEGDTVVYNLEMTDWWDDLIESLGNESSAVWTEPGWGDDVWVEIEDVGNNTYRISLFGIAAFDTPIMYTITETEAGYDKYGPAMSDGSMDSRTYITTIDADDDILYSQPIKPSYLIIWDSRDGQGDLASQDRHCHLTSPQSGFTGTVTDNYNGSQMNYRANLDLWDNCSKLLTPNNVDLNWWNGSYHISANGADIFGSPYFYTPSPDADDTEFQMRVNWR